MSAIASVSGVSILGIIYESMVPVPGAGSSSDGSSRTDKELMEAYLEGDLDAFKVLFRRYAPILSRLFHRSINDAGVVEDLVQETFLNLHRARRDFKADKPLRPYLVTIALNLKREHLRRRYRRPERSLERDDRPDTSADPSTQLERGERAERVRRALEKLPEHQRNAIELHWYAEMPFPEIAQILGASLSAVKVWAHRGYKKLRSAMEGDETRPEGQEEPRR